MCDVFSINLTKCSASLKMCLMLEEEVDQLNKGRLRRGQGPTLLIL